VHTFLLLAFNFILQFKERNRKTEKIQWFDTRIDENLNKTDTHLCIIYQKADAPEDGLQEYLYKVLVVGDIGTGKTRFV
jgi:hypothetical protein